MALKDLWDRLRGRSPRSFRARVEDLLARDDASALGNFLRTRQEEGKRLIRTWEREILDSQDEGLRAARARNITALVALYAQSFDDREPLEWFRRPGHLPEVDVASGRLEEAKKLLTEGSPGDAWAKADSGVRLLRSLPEPPDEALAVLSALLGVQGGAALSEGRLAEATRAFDESLGIARRTGRSDYLVASLINVIDVHNRQGMFDEVVGEIDEAIARVGDGTLADPLAKVLIERGVALIESGRLPDALATLDHAVRVRPTWPFPLYQRGWARFLSGDSGGALDDYRACAALKQVFFTVQREIRCLEDVAAGRIPLDAYRSFCAVRSRILESPDAVDDAMTNMLERFPTFAPGHLLRAEARLRLGDADAARGSAREALAQDPDPDTAAGALFLEWSVARQRGDAAAQRLAEERLETAYRDHPPAVLVGKAREAARDLALRWTFAFDGTLLFQEVEPGDVSSQDRKRPPPESGESAA